MTKDGGPAFPSDFITGTSGTVVGHKPFSGMSLRDWFAGQAMAAMLSEGEREGDLSLIPTSAYQYADAMLAAREATHD